MVRCDGEVVCTHINDGGCDSDNDADNDVVVVMVVVIVVVVVMVVVIVVVVVVVVLWWWCRSQLSLYTRRPPERQDRNRYPTRRVYVCHVLKSFRVCRDSHC